MEIGTIKQVDIQREMQVAYLDYAMSVIVARALPDVRDGLKPVHRRILYAMHDMGLSSDKPYKKSARIVGEVLGKYHPHGDSAVYDAMVRMAQDFSLRYRLVDGQGNFGSVDGDNPAAMRYTEARLTRPAEEMLLDMDKDTVEWTTNFDETLKEPTVLPSAFPNLVVNGASGIAVGMATNIPPHNLGEVCDALVYLIDRYHEVEDVTVEELMRFIKGPDFPTGGILYRYSADEDMIARAYASGRAHFRVQARAHIEEMSRSRTRIIVTELPYQVNKTNLLERIAELAREGKLEGVSDLRDESDRTGMHIVIEVSRTADPRTVLADLYKYTPMQQTFGMSMLALVDREPRMLSLRRVLQHYVEHRREIIRRRSAYELARARERAHILEGLLKALDHLDEVIQTIRRSQTTDTARTNLIAKFKFSEVQAQAILDMPLKRLAALERKRLQDEYQELLKRIAYLEELLASPDKILGVIREELLALKLKYADARRTQIVEAEVSKTSLTVRDMLADEPVLIAMAVNGMILRESTADRRRGKLPSKVDDHAPITLTAGSTRDEVFLFAADGRMARLPVHRLPDNNAIHPADLGAFVRSDRLIAALALDRDDDAEGQPERFLVLATRDGRIKRVTVREAWSIIGVSTAMNVEDGDELIGAAVSDGASEIMLVTKLGQAIRFAEADVRPMGLPAAGVWGIKLSRGDEVVSLGLSRSKAELIIVTTNGFFKRTPLDEYPIQGRHGGGVAAVRLAQNSGAVADARVAGPADEFFSASRRGTLRKIDLSEIPAAKRSALGKLLVQPAQGDSIVALLHLPSQRSSGGRTDATPDKKRRPAEPADQPPAPKRSPEFEFEEASLFDAIDEVDLAVTAKPRAKPQKPASAQGIAAPSGSKAVSSRASSPAQPKPAVAAKPDTGAKASVKSAGLSSRSEPIGRSSGSSQPGTSRSKTAAQAKPAAVAPQSVSKATGGTAGSTGGGAPVKKAEVKLAKAAPSGAATGAKPAAASAKTPPSGSAGGSASKPSKPPRAPSPPAGNKSPAAPIQPTAKPTSGQKPASAGSVPAKGDKSAGTSKPQT